MDGTQIEMLNGILCIAIRQEIPPGRASVLSCNDCVFLGAANCPIGDKSNVAMCIEREEVFRHRIIFVRPEDYDKTLALAVSRRLED